MLENLQLHTFTKVDLVSTRLGFVTIEPVEDKWKVFCFRQTENETFKITGSHDNLDEHQVHQILVGEDAFVQGQIPTFERKPDHSVTGEPAVQAFLKS